MIEQTTGGPADGASGVAAETGLHVGPPKAKREAPPRVRGTFVGLGYLTLGWAPALWLLVALPDSVAMVSASVVLAMLAAGAVGSALPDVFEVERAGLGGLFGRAGRELGSLVAAAGYRNTATHSAGAFLAVAAVLAPLPHFFGGVGGLLAFSVAAGFLVHVGLDLILKDAAEEKLPLLWPFARGGRFRVGGLLSAAYPRSGFVGYTLRRPARVGAVLSLAGLALCSAAVATATATAIAGPVALAGSLGAASLSAAPAGIVTFFSAEPRALAGVAFYAVGLIVVRALALPAAVRGMAVAARDRTGGEVSGGLMSWSIVALKNVRLEPAMLEALLKRVPLGERGVSLEFCVGKETEARISGRGLRALARLFSGSYTNLASVQPLDAAEAMIVPPVRPEPQAEPLAEPQGEPQTEPQADPGGIGWDNDRAEDRNWDGSLDSHAGDAREVGQPRTDPRDQEPLVAVTRRYELSGGAPELGLRDLTDLPGDPLGAALSTVRAAILEAEGERALIRLCVQEAPASTRRALRETLTKYEPPSTSEKEAEKERKRDREISSKPAPGSRVSRSTPAAGYGGSSGGPSGEPIEDFVRAAMGAAGVLIGAVFTGVCRLAGLAFGPATSRRGSRGRSSWRRAFRGRPEKAQPEAKLVRRRMEEPRLFRVAVEVVVYLVADGHFKERERFVSLALQQYLDSYSRGEAARLSETGVPAGIGFAGGTSGGTSGGAAHGAAYGVAHRRGGGIELRLSGARPVGFLRGLLGRKRRALAAMTAAEIAALWRPLGAEVETEARAESSLVVRAPSARIPKQGVKLGPSNHPDHRDFDVRLPARVLRRHLVPRGTTGMGKTAFLYMVCQEILRQPGVSWDRMGLFLLDPTRSLFDAVLANFPKRRLADVVVFDPVYKRYPCPSYNLFDPLPWLTEQELAMVLVRAVESRFPKSFGNRMRPITSNAILACVAANAELKAAGRAAKFTINDLMETRFLQPRIELGEGAYEVPEVRREVLSHLEGKKAWADLLQFWQTRDRTQTASKQEEQWQPIWNIAQVFASPQLAGVFGSPGRDFDFYSLMEDGGVLLVNADKGALPEPSGELIGTIFLELARKAAAARYSKAASRGYDDLTLREFPVVTDEVQDFACDELDTVFTQGRKWALPLVTAHQYASQLSDRLQNAFSNASTRAFFRASDDDQKRVAAAIADPRFSPEIMGSYPEWNFVLKLDSEIVTCATEPIPKVTDRMRAWSKRVRHASAGRILGIRSGYSPGAGPRDTDEDRLVGMGPDGAGEDSMDRACPGGYAPPGSVDALEELLDQPLAPDPDVPAGDPSRPAPVDQPPAKAADPVEEVIDDGMVEDTLADPLAPPTADASPIADGDANDAAGTGTDPVGEGFGFSPADLADEVEESLDDEFDARDIDDGLADGRAEGEPG